MELKVSRPVQILALVLVIAGVGGIASLQVLGKSSADPGRQLSVAQIRARARAQRPAPAAAAKSKPAAAKPAATPKPKPVVAANGLPAVLNAALRANRVVVVSIFDPQVKADAFSYAEAKAGAADAGAGFLPVSVLDDSLTGPLTTKLPGGGLLPVPGLLIYRGANADLVERVDGFADRDAVAQLALEAKTAAPLAAPAPATP